MKRSTGVFGHLVLVSGCVLAGCAVDYPVGVGPDASVPVGTDSAPVKQNTDAVVNPGVPNKGFPWPCDRWGKGAPLIESKTPLFAASHLWGGTQDDLDNVLRFYTPVLQGGTSGDFYCAVLHMLEDYRAAKGVGQFYAWWLALGNYPAKDTQLFPEYTPARLDLMGTVARDFAVDVTLVGDNNFARLFTTARKLSFDPAWATAQTKPEAESASAGLLSEPGVLARLGTRQVSPSARGAWFKRTFLCEEIPAPPTPLMTSTPVVPNQSYRQTYEQANAAPLQCRDCHRLIDPIGYALDVFDVVGRLQPLDRDGQTFVTSGEASFIDGETFKFADLADVSRRLSSSPQAKRCYVQKWLGFFDRFTGVSPRTQISVDDLVKHLDDHQGQIKFLIAAIFESAVGSGK